MTSIVAISNVQAGDILGVYSGVMEVLDIATSEDSGSSRSRTSERCQDSDVYTDGNYYTITNKLQGGVVKNGKSEAKHYEWIVMTRREASNAFGDGNVITSMICAPDANLLIQINYNLDSPDAGTDFKVQIKNALKEDMCYMAISIPNATVFKTDSIEFEPQISNRIVAALKKIDNNKNIIVQTRCNQTTYVGNNTDSAFTVCNLNQAFAQAEYDIRKLSNITEKKNSGFFGL